MDIPIDEHMKLVSPSVDESDAVVKTSKPDYCDGAKSFVAVNRESLSRMVRQKVPVGAPKAIPMTRKEERNWLKKTAGIAKRGGGRYKTMPSIPRLSQVEWKNMSRPLQSKLISLWERHSRKEHNLQGNQRLISSFVNSGSLTGESTGTESPSPNQDGVRCKTSELESIQALINEYREAAGGKSGNEQPVHASESQANSRPKASSFVRQHTQNLRRMLLTKWVTAGNKWSLPILEFVAQCVVDFEKRVSVTQSIMFHPPDPVLQPEFKAEDFVRRPVCIFDPCWKSNTLSKPLCPHCSSVLTRAGWSNYGPRRVFGEYSTIFLVGSVYWCRNRTCTSKFDKGKKSHFNSYSDELLTQLPIHLQECFPFVLSSKSGVTKRLAESLCWFKANGVGFGGVTGLLRERYALERDRHKLLFYSKCLTKQATLDCRDRIQPVRIGMCVEESGNSRPNVMRVSGAKFSEQDSPIEVPSPGYLNMLFIRLALSRRAFHEREVIALRGDALCHDETFQETKRIVVDGSQPYASLYHIMNGHGQVIAYRAIETRGSDAMRSVMRNVAARYPKGEGPEIFTSDMSCSETDLLADTFPSARVAGPRSDPTRGVLSLQNSRVHYCKDNVGLQVALQFIEVAISRGGLTVGVDLEWTSEQVPCLMQLAFNLEQKQFASKGSGRTTILLIHLSELRSPGGSSGLKLPTGLPSSLSRLAQSGAVFVGSNVRGDFTRLRNCFEFEGVPIIQQLELKRGWIMAKGSGEDQAAASRAKGLIANYQLSTLCSAVLGKRLPKPNHVRRSDWDCPDLSSEQQRYAALDALASLLIWDKLQKVMEYEGEGTEGPNKKRFSCEKRENRSRTASEMFESDAGFATSAAVAELTCETDQPGIGEHSEDCCASEHLAVTELKGDIWHFGDRLSRQLSEISDPVCQIFITRAHEAMLVPYDEDLRAVRTHLVDNRGLSADEARKVPYKYYKRFIRVRTREPEQMKDMLEQLYGIFSNAKTTSGKPAFKDGMRKEINALKGHIDDGCILDKEGFPYYYEVGKTSMGMAKYGCKRGSSALEGFHEAVDNSYSGFWCSPLLYDLTSLLFITRWNRRAAVRNLHEPDYGHFNMFLVERVINAASKVGIREYEFYKTLPPHNGETFGCGMPLTLDNMQREALEEIAERISPPENSPFYCMMGGNGMKETESSAQLLRADVDAVVCAKKMGRVSTTFENCNAPVLPPRSVSLRTGKSIIDLNAKSCRTIRSGEYLAYLAQLPSAVLPFSSLIETELLLSLLPAFFKKRRGRSVILYSKLAQVYNTCVLERLDDKRFSFKNSNYVRECAENAMRVSLIEQATASGHFILTNREQEDLRLQFRKPCVTTMAADTPARKQPQDHRTLRQQVCPSAPSAHFAPRGLPVNYRFMHSHFAVPSTTNVQRLIAPGSGQSCFKVVATGKRSGPDKCNLCSRERFPATGNGHRKDGYCPFAKTFTRRSAVGSAIRKLRKARERMSNDTDSEEVLIAQFENLRSKFPQDNQPLTLADLVENYVPQ